MGERARISRDLLPSARPRPPRPLGAGDAAGKLFGPVAGQVPAVDGAKILHDRIFDAAKQEGCRVVHLYGDPNEFAYEVRIIAGQENERRGSPLPDDAVRRESATLSQWIWRVSRGWYREQPVPFGSRSELTAGQLLEMLSDLPPETPAVMVEPHAGSRYPRTRIFCGSESAETPRRRPPHRSCEGGRPSCGEDPGRGPTASVPTRLGRPCA